MTKVKEDAIQDVALNDMPDGESAQTNGVRIAVPKAYRPLFAEVGRLSATLGIARKACYDGDPEKVDRALALLSDQVPMARQLASLLAPDKPAES